MRTAALVASVFLGILAGLPPATAKPVPRRIEEWARGAVFVVHARALSLEGLRGRYWILRSLKGRPGTREFDATLGTGRGCIPQPPELPHRAPFPAGTEVVLFLGSPKGSDFPILDGGYAWLQVPEARRAEIIEGVSRIVEIEALPLPADRLRAYFDAAGSGNDLLRGVAASVITVECSPGGKADPWRDRLVPLLRSDAVEVRVAALQALRTARAPEALPPLVQCLAHEAPVVRRCATNALAAYLPNARESALKALAPAEQGALAKSCRKALKDLEAEVSAMAAALLAILDPAPPK